MVGGEEKSFEYSVVASLENDAWKFRDTRGPEIRTLGAGSVYKGKYYFFGGKYAEQREKCPLEWYDPAEDQWGKENEYIDNRTEHSIDRISHYLLMFGGYEGQKVHNDIKVFDLNSKMWMSSNTQGISPSHRYAHGSTVIENELYIFGGMDRQKPLNDLWSYSIDSATWTKISYNGIVSPLFRSSLISLKTGFLAIGGCKEYQVLLNDTRNIPTTSISTIKRPEPCINRKYLIKTFLQSAM